MPSRASIHDSCDCRSGAGFNASIKLERTQTIMQEAGFCDFRFRVGENREP
jgi:hypothetical protein